MNEKDKQVQEAQRVPNKLDSKRTTPRHIMKMPKVKDTDRILKAAGQKQRITYKGVTIDYQLISQKKICRQEGTGKKYSK